MSDVNDQQASPPAAEGPRSPRLGKERRRGDRRNDERRGPVPLWRKPAAFVAYGVAGALVLFLVMSNTGDDGSTEVAAEIERVALSKEFQDTVPATPTGDAFTVAEYERLLAEGQNAVGSVVRTELICGSITPVAMRDIDVPHPTLVSLADEENRVAGAECRWSREGRTSDFLLVVPSNLAEEFARTPEIELNFVRQRVVPANVEWLGRSEALSLRTAGILRDIR